MSTLCQQPSEIIELIVNELDWREDLLSLALTCAHFRSIIIPSHLSYRRVVISLDFRPFFEHIAARPDLADRVRELTLLNTQPNLEVPRIHAFRRDYPKSRMLYGSGYDDEDKSAWMNESTGLWRPLDFIKKLDDALACLPRLCRLRFHLDDTPKHALRLHLPAFRSQIIGLPFERILAVHHPYLQDVALHSRWQGLKDSEGQLFPAATSYVSHTIASIPCKRS